MGNKTIFIAVAFLLLGMSGVAGYFGPDWLAVRRAQQEKESFVPAGVPKSVVSDFAAQFDNLDRATEAKRLPDIPFLDGNGKNVRMADFAGKPTLVNIWATWCAPCVVEMPSLKLLADHYAGQMNVVGISVEPAKTPQDIVKFLANRELGDFAAYLDKSGDFAKNLQLRGIPTSFLIGSDGLILYRFEGDADWASRESKAFFDIFLLQKR